ncbi:hypothetical protein BC939DRAFT_469060 [Gamsiella multidivaricata]|uniref:uncharacterized protein n=1 Tax=Gamsiella multidivaricata TaxID=101098 RepID=UPI00221EB329|nr:uncharacterized protein BC939DRAFT_469060 [Gamsiella multidivaricata]KAI7816444.1 hypothetical protein BC939DRAFT_469060 [Gamsiella multidivaricata]
MPVSEDYHLFHTPTHTLSLLLSLTPAYSSSFPSSSLSTKYDTIYVCSWCSPAPFLCSVCSTAGPPPARRMTIF